ncbi:MAG: PxxKW family cysteine-rich protein [Desulfobacterales bacterium]
MICDTIRKGSDCAFMTAKGCSYNGGLCHEIVEQCQGCQRTIEQNSGWYCAACPEPALKWKQGHCNFATHAAASADSAVKSKVNPIKASKRRSR